MTTTNAKARIQARRLLQLVTLNTVYAHLMEQQHNAVQMGKIQRQIPKAKLQKYAQTYFTEVKENLQQAESVVDVRLITDKIIKELGPQRMGFLHADWKGTRTATLEALR